MTLFLRLISVAVLSSLFVTAGFAKTAAPAGSTKPDKSLKAQNVTRSMAIEKKNIEKLEQNVNR